MVFWFIFLEFSTAVGCCEMQNDRFTIDSVTHNNEYLNIKLEMDTFPSGWSINDKFNCIVSAMNWPQMWNVVAGGIQHSVLECVNAITACKVLSNMFVQCTFEHVRFPTELGCIISELWIVCLWLCHCYIYVFKYYSWPDTCKLGCSRAEWVYFVLYVQIMYMYVCLCVCGMLFVSNKRTDHHGPIFETNARRRNRERDKEHKDRWGGIKRVTLSINSSRTNEWMCLFA